MKIEFENPNQKYQIPFLQSFRVKQVNLKDDSRLPRPKNVSRAGIFDSKAFPD